ncbi:MAG: 16S rRNA (cytidine(1402)-2'-O)-methyltransferase [Clostridiales bacterium]|nr:16S rRNA (cytidine(1402)-2'-O)-methyltransferase [Clostridiales bacterium]
MAFEVCKGTLYVVPTPIGNLSDMTERALEVLKNVDFIACEDTRVTGKLLSFFDIKSSFVSYHEHNRKKQGSLILTRLISGESAALVTDAGVPAISDPGEDLVRLCVDHGVPVVPLPGACAFVTALCASGMDSRRFCFEGFLPSDEKEKKEALSELKSEKRTMIFYEAPHRLSDTANVMLEVLGDRKICVARELTKLNEEITVLLLSQFCEKLKNTPPKGEYVLIIEGLKGEKPFFEGLSIEEHVGFYMKQGMDKMNAIKACAKDRGVSKNEIYKHFI